MYTSDPRFEKTTDKTDNRNDIPADAVVLGVDREEAIHLFSREMNTVSIIDTDNQVERIELQSRSLFIWVTITAQERGWRHLRKAEMFVEILAEDAAL